MKFIIRLFIFLIIAVTFSCEKQGLFVDCMDCTITEPDHVNLQLKLRPEYLVGITVNIYEGNIEDNIICKEYNNVTETFSYEATLNKKYSATASYVINNIKYIVINETFPRVKYTKDMCKDPCYYIYDNVLDLRLKTVK